MTNNFRKGSTVVTYPAKGQNDFAVKHVGQGLSLAVFEPTHTRKKRNPKGLRYVKTYPVD